MDAQRDAQTVVASSISISDKVRQLAAAGYSRRQIADLIDRSYQQVRQVLVEDESRAGRRRQAETGFPSAPLDQNAGLSEAPAVFGGLFRLQVEEGGVVRLPPQLLTALQVAPGSVLISELHDDHLTVLSPRAAMAKVDALMAPFRWTGGPMASEGLIAERRAQADRESNG